MFHITFPELPVVEVIPSLLEKLKDEVRLVLEAPPGAGKTSLVPLALLGAEWRMNHKILVLEPRRLAARAAAMRMSQILGEQVGNTVGYRVRMENRISKNTLIEVVTEGILTRMLQDDPTLEGISAILFDEFHERNLQSDLGLALALNCQSILRPDLRLILMSATLDTEKIASWFKATAIKSEGKIFPVSLHYLLPEELIHIGATPFDRIVALVPQAIKKALKDQKKGDLLIFLPGLGEIKKIAGILHQTIFEDIDIHMLHGDLSLQQQQLAIEPSATGKRKIILSTSIAETSITIEGVTMVIDAGYSRVSKFVARTGLTTLITIQSSKATADQRSGRAGRLGPGICYRLWTSMEQFQRPDHLEPEIKDADLSTLALELALWGIKNANELKWLDVPPPAALAQARELLIQLEALSPEATPLPHGKVLAKLGLQPRIGHMVIKGQQINLGATACALAAVLIEKDIFRSTHTSQSSFFSHHPDLRLRLEAFQDPTKTPSDIIVDEHVLNRIHKQAAFLRQRINEKNEIIEPDAAGILLALTFPDRIGQLESDGRIRLRSGQKVALATEYFEKADFFAISQLDASSKKVMIAAPLQKKDLLNLFKNQLREIEEIFWDGNINRIVSKKISRLGALILEDAPILNPDPEIVVNALLKMIMENGFSILSWSESSLHIKQRMKFLNFLDPSLWPDVSDKALKESVDKWLKPYLYEKKSLEEIKKLDPGDMLLNLLSYSQRQEMDKQAPESIEVPSGSRIKINYANCESPVLAVRLQEIFGLLETPTIANGRIPLLMHLLSPARRPVQITQDLISFWKSGYFEVRKDLRARYPKHAWPENPLTAKAIKGTKKKG